MNLSIVVPVYNSEATLVELVQRLETALFLTRRNFEIILVDDRSTDRSWEVMSALASAHGSVRILRLSRNFGQHAAITAGLAHSTGELIVVMDCDLQDQPEEIGALYEKVESGYDIVLARRMDREDALLKKLWSAAFYKCLAYLTETEQDALVANFGIYRRSVINAVLSMKDSSRYFPTMVRWVGFNVTAINVQHARRSEGESGYDFKKRLRLGVNVILAFSDKPLRLVVKLGAFVSFLSVALGTYVLIRHFTGTLQQVGWASTIVVICFFSGTIIFVLGFVGLYVGRIYDQVKGRPVYLIDEAKQTINEGACTEENS